MDTTLIQDIPQFSEWTEIKKLTKGNSKEHKYKLLDGRGQTCILRVSPVDRFHLKQQEYANLVRLEPFKLNIPKPLQFGLCHEGSHLYMLLSWIEGTTVADLLSEKTEAEQYNLGVACGGTLQILHSHSMVQSSLDWSIRYQQVVAEIMTKYYASPLRLRNEALGIYYLESQQSLLKDRPLVIKHGDYHAANLIFTPANTIGMIDFDRCIISDPYEEFAILVWTAKEYPAFARGQIAGYFDNQIPADFFPLLTYYITVYAFEHISWALGYGKQRPETIQATAEELIDLFDGYRYLQPKWYPDACRLRAERS